VNDDRNIVLIGMPGVGKSTVGVLLAKELSMQFLDTDVLIQTREGQRLQDMLNALGVEAFCQVEERHVLSLDCRATVIATGGSVVYSDRAMRHLKSFGLAVHLHLPLHLLRRRLNDLDSRGVVMPPGQTLEGLFAQREPLYARYADVSIDCKGRTHWQVVRDIVRAVAG
jgi:shikimate kinase